MVDVTQHYLTFLFLAFTCSFIVEVSNVLFSFKPNKLDVEFSGDLKLKVTNFDPNIGK